MVDQFKPLSIDLSQRIMFPTCPVKLMFPLLAPAHTLTSPVLVPPTVIGLTVIWTSSLDVEQLASPMVHLKT
jgi:hypothetical protein